jgi:RNA polymerase sigma factor (sigma-70 family)
MGRLTHETVEHAIAGDAAALEALWVVHRGWIAAVALAHAPRSADLEDIMQDIALNMVRSIHTVREPAAIAGWLREIARNTSVAAGRKATRRRVAFARHALHLTTAAFDENEAGEKSDDLDLLRQLVETLSENYREPLLLCAVRGMSHKQIADLLDLTPTAVETRIRRARRMLRDRAAEHQDAEHARAEDPETDQAIAT